MFDQLIEKLKEALVSYLPVVQKYVRRTARFQASAVILAELLRKAPELLNPNEENLQVIMIRKSIELAKKLEQEIDAEE